MTPQEKAKEIFDKMLKQHYRMSEEDATSCSIILVDEILTQFNWLNTRMIAIESAHFLIGIEIQFYQQVRQCLMAL